MNSNKKYVLPIDTSSVIHKEYADNFIPVQNFGEMASGWDLRANITSPIYLEPGAGIAIKTGCNFDFMPLNASIKEVYPWIELDPQIRPRSSMSRANIYVMIGTIDVDFHGEPECHIINLSKKIYTISPLQKVGQLVFGLRLSSDFINPIITKKDTFTKSNRGEKGYGSSGKF